MNNGSKGRCVTITPQGNVGLQGTRYYLARAPSERKRAAG